MRRWTTRVVCLWVFALTARDSVRAAVVFGQLDDFQDGTTMGWQEGEDTPNPPTNVSTGGPNGAGDRFLRNISSGGNGEGSKMIIFNTASRWTGNYNTAGVTRIDASLANFGATPLRMRVALESGTTRFASTSAITLPADRLWRQVSFNLTPGSMTRVGGSGTLASVLGAVGEIRILSSGSPSFMGEPIVGNLGVDKLRALRLPGDANFDGRVSFADFQRLERNFGRQSGAQWAQGDFNFDGRVNDVDFGILRSGFGTSVAAEPVPASTAEWAAIGAFATSRGVPEPAGLLFLALAGFWSVGGRGTPRGPTN